MYVLMVSPNKFPNGDAGAVRDGYFAKIYQELGYSVYHIGMGTDTTYGEYNGVTFFSIYKNNKSYVRKIINNLNYRTSLNSVYKRIEQAKGLPSLIHIYDIPKAGICWALSLACENNIKIIHDSVEWYSPCEFSLGKFAYPYILKNRTNTKLIRKPIRVITISTYLNKYFLNKGLSTVRVPVIMDPQDYHPQIRRDEQKIIIVYAGSPAKKDYLFECIQAFIRLPEEIKQKFEFRVIGASREYVASCCAGYGVPVEIKSFGRVPREVVIKNLEEADFSVLLRPENERYTKAGFPTKSVEALMNGCALLCNLSSDLGLYLQDGVNAIIAKDSTIEAMEQGFLRASELSHADLQVMRNSARQTAVKYFDYRNYIDLVREFIETN